MRIISRITLLSPALCLWANSGQAQTVGYIADIAGPFGGAGNNGGLNIGHKFTVTGAGIKVFSIGAYDYQGNGLNASHIVALFSGTGAGSTPVTGGSVTVPSGTAAPLTNGFRMAALAAPVALPAGDYSVIVYQMNGGGGSDGYAEANNTRFIGDGNVSDGGTTFNFDTATFPTYPYQNSAGGLASASFIYSPILATTDYAPITLAASSFTRDMIVEATAPTASLNGAYTTASMDGGTANNGYSWYELGYDRAAVTTGIPNAGSTISSSSAPDHYYTFAPSYAANDVAFIDSSHSATLTPAQPDAFSALSVLTSAGGGSLVIDYYVDHADGTTEAGTISSPDWFGNTPVAWTANGRVDVSSGGLDNVNNNAPLIYYQDIALGNTQSQVTRIRLSSDPGYPSGAKAVVFAVSGIPTFPSPTAPFNAVALPASQTQYVGGVASFSVSASGSTPLAYQWWKGASPLSGKTSSTLTLSSLALGDAGSYTCVVSNATGLTATSSIAALSVLDLPQGVSGAVLSDLPLAYYRLNAPGPLVTEVANNSGSLGAAGNGTHFPGMTHQVAGALAGSTDTAAGYTGIDKQSCDGGVPTRVPFNAAFNTSTFTVEAWLKPTISGTANAQTPLYNRKEDSPRTGWVIFQRAGSTQPTGGNDQPSDRGWNFRAYNGVDTSRSIDLTGGSYTVGQWSHLVITFDGSTATMYVNGAPVASQGVVGSYAPNTSDIQFCVGGYFDASQNPFTGSIDEVALYGVALTDVQVMAHYSNGTSASRSTPYETLVATDGAIEYFRLNEPALNVALNYGSLGSLANGSHANTLIGAAGPEAPVFPGFEATNHAVSFNGTNSYIELENPSGLNFTGPLTLEAWVLPNASQNFESYILAHGGNDDFSGETILRLENGVYQIASNNGGAGFPAPAGDLGGGHWVHLAGTWDGSNWHLYRNGVSVASSPDNSGPYLVNNANWAIGARGRWKRETGLVDAGQDTRMFNGYIDEAAIYGYALTPGQIQAHYAKSVQPLAITDAGGQVTITWPLGTLQQSDNVTGTYTDLVGATSPYHPPVGPAKKFYRVKF